jgi:hypothetical protein
MIFCSVVSLAVLNLKLFEFFFSGETFIVLHFFYFFYFFNENYLVNTAMRDLLANWACLLNFESNNILNAKREVAPGVNEATSHVGVDEIISLKFGGVGTSILVRI